MNEPLRIHIGQTEHEFLSVALLGRSHPNATDKWDGKWLNVLVNLRVSHDSGEFQGKLRGQLLANEPGTGDTLSFRLEVDQTYLPAIMRSIDQILAAYPVIEDL